MFGKAIYFIILVIFCNQAKAQIDLPNGQYPLDVYFLADNTGSMSAEITEVREQARIIFNDIAARATSNVRFGVGAYKDFNDNFIFKNILSLTEENMEVPIEQDPIVQGMKQWEASGGGDEPEAQLYAMAKIAGEQYQEIGWREDAVKMLVWFGDAPGKDPALRINRVPITEEYVIDALKKAGILVIALDVKNMTEQAERIADATGGKYVFVERERQQGQSPSPLTSTSSPFSSPSPSPSPTPTPPSPSPSPTPTPTPLPLPTPTPTPLPLPTPTPTPTPLPSPTPSPLPPIPAEISCEDSPSPSPVVDIYTPINIFNNFPVERNPVSSVVNIDYSSFGSFEDVYNDYSSFGSFEDILGTKSPVKSVHDDFKFTGRFDTFTGVKNPVLSGYDDYTSGGGIDNLRGWNTINLWPCQHNSPIVLPPDDDGTIHEILQPGIVLTQPLAPTRDTVYKPNKLSTAISDEVSVLFNQAIALP